jgi:hypothetical protein
VNTLFQAQCSKHANNAVNINYLYLINYLWFMLMSIYSILNFRGGWHIPLQKEKKWSFNVVSAPNQNYMNGHYTTCTTEGLGSLETVLCSSFNDFLSSITRREITGLDGPKKEPNLHKKKILYT